MEKRGIISKLMLDVNQAAELKMSFRRNGWTNADIKALSKGNVLGKVLEFIKENENALRELEEELTFPIKEKCCNLKNLVARADETADNLVMNESLNRDIERVLSTLSHEEIFVVKNYFGIGTEKMKVKKIAAALSVDKSEIFSMRDKAIAQLKNSRLCCCMLKEYLN